MKHKKQCIKTREHLISPSGKRWKARLMVSFIMLLLAFLSLILMEIHQATYWIFTYIMAGIDALLSIWLVWYLKAGRVWRVILHWMGLIAVMYLMAIFVDRGVVSQTEAGLFALVVLAFALYLAGIYTDIIFILIGMTLAILALGIILLKSYLWLIMVPVIVIAAIIIVVIVIRDRRKVMDDV